MSCFGLTDRGIARQENQDSFLIENCEKASCSIIALCDGMGGANAGGLASQLSAKAFVNYVYHHLSTYPTRLTDYPRVLREACDEANGVAYAYSQFGDELTGMGTTLVAAVIRKNGSGYVLNVGDSRAYILHRKSLKQITRDHSLVEEMVRMGGIDRVSARNHPDKNIITRAIGATGNVNIDFFEVPLRDKDIILMCSDGLSNMIEDKDILEIVASEESLESKAAGLIATANENGGSDNISVVLIAYEQ